MTDSRSQPIVARLRHLAKLIGFDLPVVLNEAADRIEELEARQARAERAEGAVDVLESNGRVQARLLADTGRRVKELEAQLAAWAKLGTIEASKESARKAARIDALEETLRGLTNCADGLSFTERDMRLAIGNTNWSVLRHWIAEARAILPPILDPARSPTAGDGK